MKKNIQINTSEDEIRAIAYTTATREHSLAKILFF
jgi:hypothetical protein